MRFVKTDNLKIGMRLARPIFSKKGVLLFDRDSLLTSQAIESVRNFGLFGIYVLDPAEPLPPMSEEDMEFERFQITTVNAIEEELDKVLKTGKCSRLETIAGIVTRNYGHLEEKINFYQNLRSREDYISRHALNVAILCAMMTHERNIRIEDQHRTVCAALLHDVGKVGGDLDGIYGMPASEEELDQIYAMQQKAFPLIEEAVGVEGAPVRRICAQASAKQLSFFKHTDGAIKGRTVPGTDILLVANRFDEICGMSLQGTARSEVKAIQEFVDHPEIYDEATVLSLIHCINILFPGVSVELSTGEKALVLTENEQNILRPTVVSFRDNSILDLSLRENSDIYIKDVMKTMDNRYIMKQD